MLCLDCSFDGGDLDDVLGAPRNHNEFPLFYCITINEAMVPVVVLVGLCFRVYSWFGYVSLWVGV